MTVFNINGRRINIPSGRSISIINGNVFVDGRLYVENDNLKQVNIVIEGGCYSLQIDSCNRVEVTGDVRGALKAGGTVIVHGNALSKVEAGGNVTCGYVSGNVDAGGNVKCGNVAGSVDAGGTVIRR